MAIDKTTTAKAVTSGTQLSSVGTVKTIVGLVKAVDANGAERVLQVGDKVFANETIITSVDGGVIIEFPNGSHLDLPRSAHIVLDAEIYSASASKPIEQEASDEAARIARAIAEGRDPNAVTNPAAAGGETGDEGTTTPLVIDFDNTQGNVNSGYPTGPISLSFPSSTIELPPVEATPTSTPLVSVTILPPPPPPEGEPPIVVRGNVADVIEGTNVVEGVPGTRPVTFTFQLTNPDGTPYSLVHDPVTVVYHLENGTAVYGKDYTDGGTGAQTIVIPTGSNTYSVTVYIYEDLNVETNETFKIVLDSAVGATIAVGGSEFTVNIINDDHAPVAVDDTNSMTENDASVSGNVISNDTDADGQTLSVVGAMPITITNEYGTLVIHNATGAYTFTPNAETILAAQALDDGEAPLIVVFPDAYKVTDGANESNLADVRIAINGVDDAMVVQDDTDSFSAAAVQTTVAGVTNVLSNDSDPDTTDNPLLVNDTTTQNVYLLNNDGTLSGTVAGTITIASNGSYSLNLNQTYKDAAVALDAGETFRVGVTYTAINQDAATADAILRITVNGANEAPTITANATSGTVYEAGLLSGSGTGPGASISATGTFTIADTDGLDDIKSVTIAGQTYTVADYANFAAFTAAIIAAAPIAIAGGYGTVDITGYSAGTFNYTYTLTKTYDGNGLGAGYNTVPDADSFVVSVSDGTASAASATVNIDIVDDVVLFTIVNDGADADGAVTLSALNPASNTTYNGQFADWDFGADGFGSANVTVPSNVQVISTSATQIVLGLYEGSTQVGILTLNSDGTDSLQVIHRDGEVVFTPVAATSAVAGGPTGSLLVDLGAAADFNILVSGSDGDDNTTEFGGGQGASDDDLVNTSSNGWAVKGLQGQTNELNQSIMFKFVDDGNNLTGYGIGDFKFKAEGFTGGITSATITVKVYLDAAMTTYDEMTFDVTSGQVVQISSLNWALDPNAGTGDYVAGNDIFAVEVISAEPLGSYRLNGVEVGSSSDTPPPDLSFQNITVTLTDGDGDTASQTFNVTIDGDAGSQLTVEAIAGTSVNDILVGTAGDDFMIGGSGNDTLTGNGGSDTFIWNAGNTGHDVVTDFDVANDVLNVADLLSGGGLTMSAVAVDGHLQLQFTNDTNTVVQTIDVNSVAASDLTATTVMNTLLLNNDIID